MFTTHRKAAFSGELPPVSEGLVGRWLFDEPSGNIAIDSSVEGNDGTLVNGPTRWTSGVAGPALSLQNSDGIDIQAVEIPNAASLTASMSFSALMWVNTVGTFYGTGASLFHKDLAAPDRSFYLNLLTATGRIRILVSGTGSNVAYRDGSTNVLDGEWHHVAAVYDSTGQNLNLYVDGMNDDGALTGTVPSVIHTNTSYLAIGKSVSDTLPYNGSIAEPRFYDRALTPAEILSIYNGTG